MPDLLAWFRKIHTITPHNYEVHVTESKRIFLSLVVYMFVVCYAPWPNKTHRDLKLGTHTPQDHI